MPRFPSFLDRFRRLLAPPGRPAEALGVPASAHDLESELAPLVGDLDALGEQAEEIRRGALEEVERRWIPAHEEALAALELTLEELEREDGARVRRLTAA